MELSKPLWRLKATLSTVFTGLGPKLLSTELNMAKSTYFFDIFGTVLSHHGHHDPNAPHPATPGSKEKLEKLHNEGHKIVLMTSHGESDRTWIVHALHKAGITYDHLLLDAGHGTRHLVDDKGAKAVHVKTNEGLGNVNL